MPDRLQNVHSEIDPVELANPTLAFLHAYWNTKRGDRAMPSRSDIRPSELKGHLGWVLIMEVLPDMSDFRYKLIGTLVTAYFRADNTGKTVSEAFAWRGPDAVKAIQSSMRQAARKKLPVRVFGDAGWIDDGYEEFDAIYLPLSDDGKTANMILHAFVFDKDKVIMAREIARTNDGERQVPSSPVRLPSDN